MNPTNEQELRDKLWNMEIGYITKTDGEKLIHYLATETIDRIYALITAHTNAEIARTLDRLESEVQGIATSKPTVAYATSIPTNKVLYTIQAERAKLKEVK